MKPSVSIITPWRNNAMLIPDYEQAARGAQVIIIDNASEPAHANAIGLMVQRLDGVYVRNETNRYFASANNQGLAHATGDIVLFLNNDIRAAPGWLDLVRRDTAPNALCGPSRGCKMAPRPWSGGGLVGQPLCYLEGWCIAGRRETWARLGGWDAERFLLPYWDDNDVCYRAARLGMHLVRTRWPIQHLGGTTTRETPEAQAAIGPNERIFRERVIELWHERSA